MILGRRLWLFVLLAFAGSAGIVLALALWSGRSRPAPQPHVADSPPAEPGFPTAVSMFDEIVQRLELPEQDMDSVSEEVNRAIQEAQTPNEEPSEQGPDARPPGAAPTAVAATNRPGQGITPGPGSRLVVGKLGLNAPISIKGLGPGGVMQDPNGPWDVAWYNFTAWPGAGNAVFSGHVDYAGVGPAVFAGLGALANGDTIQFSSAGTTLSYRVVSNVLYTAGTAPVAAIVGQNGQDAVTLITCGGTWNAAARDYSHRRVVRAVRVQ